MWELAISDVEPMCGRFPGGRHGELGQTRGRHEDYNEREVAGGAEDYYAMRGEAAGEWIGSGAEALGLEGSAAGATRQGRVGAPVASAAGVRRDDRAGPSVSRRDAIDQSGFERQGKSANRILALTDASLAQREIVALEPKSGTPGRLGDQLPLRYRAAVLDAHPRQGTGPARVGGPSAVVGRGRRSERGRHRRSARPSTPWR